MRRRATSASRRRPRRSFAAWAARSAARFSGGVNISPDEVHALDPVIRHDFLLAFVDALQPVFAVGAAVTLIAFPLAWLLKEDPLRTTTQAPSDPVTHP